MSEPAAKPQSSLSERFWSLARVMKQSGDPNDPVAVVRHVLRILDALDRGEQGNVVSVATMSFLKLLRESEIAGDLSYASPEQVRGEMIDERSLVFSVGVLLFERLTGRHPFGAEASGRRVSRIRKGEFGSGVNYFPTVPAGLRQVLMRAMGPFPEERYASLRQLRARLEQFAEQQSPAPYLPGTTNKRVATMSDDDTPTRVVDMQRVLLEREISSRTPTDPNAAARVKASSRTPTASGEVDTRTAQVATLEEGPRIYIKPKSRMTPLVWAAGGAALASVVFFMLQRPSASTTAATHAAATATATNQAKTSPATKHRATHKASATAKTKAAATATPVATKAKPAAAGPVTIDASKDTEALGKLLGPCFGAERRKHTVQFGLSLLYGKHDGKVKQRYFSGKGAVTHDERICIDTALKRLVAKPSPHKIIGYSLLFHADGRRIHLL